MATAKEAPPEISSFENEISEAKREIETRFRELINRLRERERELVIELEQILETYKRERDKHKHSLITELEAKLKFAKENFKSNDLNEFTESIIQQLTEKREKFKSEFDCKLVSVEFDETVLRLAGTIGRVTVTDSTRLASRLSVVEYEGIVSPVLSIGGESGDKEGQFSSPFGVSVHYLTGKIFVADQCNHRVQVFDKDQKYLYKFRDRDGAGKMKKPLRVDFYQNKVFVSQRSGCLLVYDSNGTFLQQIGTPGNGEGQFDQPHGITINHSNGEVFVCDYSNNRVQIFSKDFLFKSQFGQGILKYPIDIKLSSEFIYVLSHNKPFLYSFRHDLTQIQSPVLTFISKHLGSPWSFCIDGAGNFIISDYNQNAIIIFNHQGDVFHRITDSVKSPTCVTLDVRGRIILVGYNHSLLIF